jgi:hypothetical protein
MKRTLLSLALTLSLPGCITIDAGELFTIKNPAVFEIHDLPKEKREEITNQIARLIEEESDAGYKTMVQDQGEPYVVKAGPVPDPAAFAKKITFGKATADGTTITIKMKKAAKTKK